MRCCAPGLGYAERDAPDPGAYALELRLASAPLHAARPRRCPPVARTPRPRFSVGWRGSPLVGVLLLQCVVGDAMRGHVCKTTCHEADTQ